ncbi:MAG: hypothetical protein ACLFWH_06435 [Actinomycetota bacterium]
MIETSPLGDRGHLTWRLEPAQWPEHPVPVDEWLGSAELDGRPLPISEVPKLLRVFRIAGDETLSESLGQRVRRDLELTRQVGDKVEAAGTIWDLRVRQVEEATSGVRRGKLEALHSEVREASEQLDEARGQHHQLRERLEGLNDALDLLDAQREMTTRLPAIQSQLLSLRQRRSKAEQELRRLDDKAGQILGDERRSRQQAKQFEDDERLLRLRRDRLQRRIWEVNRALTAMTSVPDIDRDDPEAREKLAAHIADLRQELAVAERERLSIDRQGVVRELASDVDDSLQRGIEDGLGDEAIADLRGERISIEDLSDGIEALDSQRPITTEQVELLRQRIGDLENDLDEATRLDDAIRLYQKAVEDVDATEESLQTLLERLTDPAAQSYRELQDSRSALVDELALNAIETGELEREQDALLAAADPGAIAEQLEGLGLDSNDEESIQEAHAAAKSDLDESEGFISELANREGEAKAELRAEEAAIRSAAEALRSEDLSWFVARTKLDPKQDDPLDAQETRLAAISTAAEAFAKHLLTVSNDVQAMENALGWLARSIEEGTRPGHEALRLVPSLIRRYEREFAEYLSAPEVIGALFDGGSDLQVDLSKLTTTWVTPQGERRTRPIEAFSSGEKAFAYTRVQLEQVAEGDAEKKVVFLDEFGAYVARDRFEELETFIRKRALPDLADQVVIVLPLTQEPSDVEHRQQLEENGLFWEILT